MLESQPDSLWRLGEAAGSTWRATSSVPRRERDLYRHHSRPPRARSTTIRTRRRRSRHEQRPLRPDTGAGAPAADLQPGGVDQDDEQRQRRADRGLQPQRLRRRGHRPSGPPPLHGHQRSGALRAQPDQSSHHQLRSGPARRAMAPRRRHAQQGRHEPVRRRSTRRHQPRHHQRPHRLPGIHQDRLRCAEWVPRYQHQHADDASTARSTTSRSIAASSRRNVSARTTRRRAGTSTRPTLPPTAQFTSSVDELSATFDGSGSVDLDGTIESYEWAFGDGASGLA
jgi:hypothetical protein